MDCRPLIVTLRLDLATQAWFDEQRRAHFPARRNVLAAHLTLFHALPGASIDAVRADMAAAAADCAPFPLRITGLRSLGRGVAYQVASVDLLALHARFVRCWSGVLTRQDAQRFAPHVTVQNKVEPAAARALLAELQNLFVPRRATAAGLDLWRYAGGPWEAAGGAQFLGAAGAVGICSPPMVCPSASTARTNEPPG